MKHRASNPSTSSAITGFLRCLPVALIGVVPWTTTARAHGKSEWGSAPQTCVDAYTDGREREGAGAVVAARALFQICSNPQCGKRLRRECLSRQSQLQAGEAALPLPSADEKGPLVASQAPVEVMLDGRPFTSGVPGAVLPLDPGVHEFSFHARGQVLGKQEVLIGPNRCDSPISLSLRPDDARSTTGEPRAPTASIEPPTQDRPRAASPAFHEDTSAEGEDQPAARRASWGRRLIPYLLATVGVAGIGGFVLGTAWGRKDNAALDSCSPNCQQTSVDHVKRLYLAANVSLGIGVAALSSAALVWAISPSRADKEQESARRSASHPPRSSTDPSLAERESLPPMREPAHGFGMYPTQGGAYAHFSGSF